MASEGWAMMSADSWTLKVELDGDVRRLKDWIGTGDEPTCGAATEAVAQLFGLSTDEVQGLTLKYKDDDGDMCTLTDATIPDALSLASESHVLRLTACRPMRPQVPLGEHCVKLHEYICENATQLHSRVRRRTETLRQDLQEGVGQFQASTAPLRQSLVERVATARERAGQGIDGPGASRVKAAVSDGAVRIQELAHAAYTYMTARSRAGAASDNDEDGTAEHPAHVAAEHAAPQPDVAAPAAELGSVFGGQTSETAGRTSETAPTQT